MPAQFLVLSGFDSPRYSCLYRYYKKLVLTLQQYLENTEIDFMLSLLKAHSLVGSEYKELGNALPSLWEPSNGGFRFSVEKLAHVLVLAAGVGPCNIEGHRRHRTVELCHLYTLVVCFQYFRYKVISVVKKTISDNPVLCGSCCLKIHLKAIYDKK